MSEQLSTLGHGDSHGAHPASHGGPMLEPCLPEGLPSMVQTDAGAAGEELKPVGLTLCSSKRRVKGWSNREKALRTDCTA